VLNLSSLKLNKPTQVLLSRGHSYCSKTFSCPSSFNYDLLSFVRKLRFNLHFQSYPKEQNKSPYIALLPSHADPPNNSSNDIFENDIQFLENFPHNDSQIPNNNSELEMINFLKKQSKYVFCKADKGGCLVILNKVDYNGLVMQHLNDTKTYSEVTNSMKIDVKAKITQFVSQYENLLRADEKNYLLNIGSGHSIFYILPKIHKSEILENTIKNDDNEYIHVGSCPNDLSSRPIVNNIHSPTANISHFLDKVLAPLIDKIPGYIKNSYDLIKKLPKKVQFNSKFINLDVVSLYTVIPKDYGLMAIEYFLTKYPCLIESRFSKQFIFDALNLVLNNNFFEYSRRFYLQLTGTAMGTPVAPKYASLVMAFLELQIKETCQLYFGYKITASIFHYYWRYLDDILIICDLQENDIMTLIYIFDHAHPSFKFTTSISSSSCHFLDIFIYTQNFKIYTDIFYKPTDSHQYLHFYSNHPRHIKRNIPYCLAKRICNIVSDKSVKMKRLKELQTNLLSLEYPLNLIEDAIAKSLSNKKEITKKTITNSIPFVFTYDKHNIRLYNNFIKPQIEQLNKRSFYNNPLFIYKSLRQSPNLLKSISNKYICGVYKCKRPRCKTCENILETRIKIDLNNKTIYFNKKMNCCTKNVIYALICSKCQKFYIGETKMSLSLRNNLHRQQIHQCHYSILHVSKHIRECGQFYHIIPLFKLNSNSSYLRLKMENYFINYLNPHLNKI
jgi:hypothetical protein